jgi:hypothetical protein
LEGYFDKELKLAGMLRISSFRIHQSLCGKDSLDIEAFWPLKGDRQKSNDTFTADREMVEKIMAIHNFKK